MSKSNDDEHIVRYVPKPLTKAQIARLEALRDLPDEKIDFSDIPEMTDEWLDKAVKARAERLAKRQITLRLDGAVIDWFRDRQSNGKGYQTDINRALREYIAGKQKKAARRKAG
jgi:uncharacterized protein (DUF4415 family)